MADPAGRIPPNDEGAELAVLGATLMRGSIPPDADGLLAVDFYRPRNEQIWNAILSLEGQSKPTDTAAVAAQLALTNVHEGRSELDRVGGPPYLLSLMRMAALGNVDHHVAVLKDRTLRRDGIEAARRIADEFYRSEDDALAVLDRAEARLSNIPAREVGKAETLMTIGEFVAQDLPPEQWVIPGLLEEGDRLIITGSEGSGKSTLCRQFAVCCAAGMHPFNGSMYKPKNTLVIDAENPNRLMVSRFLQMRDMVERHAGKIEDTKCWIDRAPQGLNLLDPAARRWLNQKMALTNPKLLVIGPIYKLFVGDPSDEQTVAEVVHWLDDFRERYGCALVMEHHQPKGSGDTHRTVQPIGSSVWLRWPEFGYGIRKVEEPNVSPQDAARKRLVEFVPWRGPRDGDRDFPWYLQSGVSEANMPWVETMHLPD